MSLLKDLQEKLNGLNALEILKVLSNDYVANVSFATSLGMEDQVISHMISTLDKKPRVFTLDTGRLFQETCTLIDKTKENLNIDIEIFFPDFQKIEKLTYEKGMNSFYESIENRKECCGLRKIEPLKRALKDTKIWITGLRSEQSVTRIDMDVVEFDEGFGVIKINPLLSWSLEMIQEYIKKNDVPQNPLHSKGFISIGCAPCTKAVSEGEDIRAGRWWWENPEHKECGLHGKK